MATNALIEPQMRARIPLYAAGLGASAMGLAALHAVLTGGEFASFAFTLLAIGYCISWGARARVISNSALAAIAFIILLSTLSVLIIEPQFRYELIPSEVLEAPDLLAAIALASLMVVYSFKLTTDMSVLFLCVPSLSLIGLLATADPTAEMLTYFGIYLAFTSFAMIRQNALASMKADPALGSRLNPPASGRADPISRSSVKLHIGMTIGFTLTALAVGSLVGTSFSPLLARAFMTRLSDLDVSQFADPAGEEFVPIATGPILLSDQELMTVKCRRALLWRERTYNKYTGQGWSSVLLPQERKRIRPTAKRGKSKLSTFKIVDGFQPDRRSAVEMVEQTFHITSGAYYPVFAAPEPEVVTFEAWQPHLRLASGLEAGRPYKKGTTYHVVSRVSIVTPRQLRTASNVYPEIVKARYLGTPQSCWQVQKLTSRLTETASTPLQKAQAIYGYLSANFAYDTNAPAAPSDKDAVTYFLFESQRGYCDIFASAMVIMCRQAGIPARWATGFVPGEFNSADGAYHVRVKDKHAWAELYFPEYGWIPFDVTPARQGGDLLARLRDYWRTVASDRGSLFAGILLIALIGYLIKAEVVDRFRQNAGRPVWSCAAGSTEIGECYQRMCRVLARYGYPRYPAMTPLEYARNLKSEIRNPLEAVDFLTAGFVEFRYSDRAAPPEIIQAMKAGLQALARDLKNAKRRKLLPRRQRS